MKKLTICLIALTVASVGCATRPAEIPAAVVPKSQFANMDCAVLRTEMRVEQERLLALSSKQKGARTRDIWVNILTIPGVGAALPNHEDDIAQSKGKINAMDAELSRRCSTDESRE